MRFRNPTMLMWMVVSLAGNGQPAARAQEDVPSEYEMKAAFLFNFAKFVEWPADAVRDPHAPFVIGVFGMSPFGDALEQSVKGKTANNRPLTVRQFQNLSEVKGCQILFISKSERKRVREVAKALDRRPVLTVSEVDRFMHTGLMVNFFKEGNKVRFEINDEVAKKAGLRISSKLLTLSRRQEDK